MSARLSFRHVFLSVELGWAFFSLLTFTPAGLYMIQEAHLDAFQLVLVGTVLEVSAFVCEVPTGVVADTISRKTSIIIGTAIMGVGFIVWGAVPEFAAILAAQVLWGAGSTFISGAFEAWAADESQTEDFGHLLLLGSQAASVGSFAGLGAAVLLAMTTSLAVPMVAGGIGYLAMAVLMMRVVPEQHFTPAEHHDGGRLRAMRSTLVAGITAVRTRPVLVTILLITFLAGAASEAFDRLWQLHLLDEVHFPATGDLDPIAWIGLIQAASLLLGFAAAQVVRRRLDTRTHRGAAYALLVLDVITAVAVIGFGIAGGFAAAVSLYLVARMMRGLSDPIHTAWLNQSLDPRIRATVISLDSQTDALGQMLAGPAIGALALAAGTGSALVAVGVLVAPSAFLYVWTIRRHDDRPSPLAEAVP